MRRLYELWELAPWTLNLSWLMFVPYVALPNGLENTKNSKFCLSWLQRYQYTPVFSFFSSQGISVLLLVWAKICPGVWDKSRFVQKPKRKDSNTQLLFIFITFLPCYVRIFFAGLITSSSHRPGDHTSEKQEHHYQDGPTFPKRLFLGFSTIFSSSPVMEVEFAL